MRTCIITGANSGIGKCAAMQLAQQGLQVIMACRNINAAQECCKQIQAATGNNNVFARKVDLSLISDTKRFALEFTKEFGVLDILINNAADFDISRKEPQITKEQNEAQFTTNLLAPFILIRELMPMLKKSDDARILNISSQGLILYPNIKFDFDNINGGKKYRPAKTYYQTKFGLLLLSLYLRDQLLETNISVYTVRVTNVKIDISRYPNLSHLMKTMYKLKSRFSISPEEMAKVYTNLSIGEKLNGFYYDEKLNEVRCNKNAYDKASQEQLWYLCEQLQKI